MTPTHSSFSVSGNSLNTLLAYLLRLWYMGIIVESMNVMPVHLPKAPRLRKNMSWKNTRFSNSTKGCTTRLSVLHHRTLYKEQVVVLEIAECIKMKIQQNSHDFTVGQRCCTPSTLHLLLSSSKFPAFSASKCLQNSSIIQNNSVTL